MDEMVLVFESRKADVIVTDKIQWSNNPALNCLAVSCARERAEWETLESMRLVMASPL